VNVKRERREREREKGDEMKAGRKVGGSG